MTETEQVLSSLGIDPSTLPPGTASLLYAESYRNINEETKLWAGRPDNNQAVAYEIETEHKRHTGLLLRNLHLKKPKAAHLTIVPADNRGPFWHNFTPALDYVWQLGVVVLVEGPKDARVIFGKGILPVMAYLGPVPSKGHLVCISRYAHSILWIPDNEPLTFEVQKRRADIPILAKQLGLAMFTKRLNVKDPALLWDRPDDIDDIYRRIQDISRLGGGGYVGSQAPTENT